MTEKTNNGNNPNGKISGKVIWDFDGTITLEWVEAIPFREKFFELYAATTGIDVDKVKEIYETIAYRSVLTDNAAGWNIGGNIVCPATSSEYVLTTTIFQHMYNYAKEGKFNEYNEEIAKMDDAALRIIYPEAYAHSGIEFKKGAKSVLEAYKDRSVIVTNSADGPVRKKLEMLGVEGIPIYTNAAKFIITGGMTDVPETIQPEGFPRPIHLQRGKYRAVLETLAKEGFRPEETTVVGDVFELDLALPQQLGYNIVAVDNRTVNHPTGLPDHEVFYLKNTKPATRIIADLRDLL